MMEPGPLRRRPNRRARAGSWRALQPGDLLRVYAFARRDGERGAGALVVRGDGAVVYVRDETRTSADRLLGGPSGPSGPETIRCEPPLELVHARLRAKVDGRWAVLARGEGATVHVTLGPIKRLRLRRALRRAGTPYRVRRTWRDLGAHAGAGRVD